MAMAAEVVGWAAKECCLPSMGGRSRILLVSTQVFTCRLINFLTGVDRNGGFTYGGLKWVGSRNVV